MKTIARISAVLIALASLALAQAPKHDTSTLEKALIGHWFTDDGKTHYYFAADGKLVMIDGDRTQEQTWKVKSKDEAGNKLVLDVRVPSTGGGHTKTLRFTTPERDRIKGQVTFQDITVDSVGWKWVDARQHPDTK